MKLLEIGAAVAVLVGGVAACLINLSREKHDESKTSKSAQTPTVTLTSMNRPTFVTMETLSSRMASPPPPFADIKRPEVSEDEFFQGLHVMEVDRG